MMRKLAAGALVLGLVMAGCAPSAGNEPPPGPAHENSPEINLTGIKQYLLSKSADLQKETSALKQTADAYYELAKGANFDYAALWQGKTAAVAQLLADAKAQFVRANPAYETMEGIVAGVPELADFDVTIDAGAAGSEDPESAVSFDLTLPDGKVLERPGNYFFLAEATLWGTNPAWTAAGVKPDLDGDGQVEFGEALPDANVLKGVADGFAAASNELAKAAQAWTPTADDAFTALVVMTPTMDEYFQAWKESRFVSGENAISNQFVAVSRVQDINDILAGLLVVYNNVRPMIQAADAAQAEQTGKAMDELQSFVANVLNQEKDGKRYTPEEADLLGAEAQNRATAIVGQVQQAAAKLKITIKE